MALNGFNFLFSLMTIFEENRYLPTPRLTQLWIIDF
jgi:hypothetical protein